MSGGLKSEVLNGKIKRNIFCQNSPIELILFFDFPDKDCSFQCTWRHEHIYQFSVIMFILFLFLKIRLDAVQKPSYPDINPLSFADSSKLFEISSHVPFLAHLEAE